MALAEVRRLKLKVQQHLQSLKQEMSRFLATLSPHVHYLPFFAYALLHACPFSMRFAAYLPSQHTLCLVPALLYISFCLELPGCVCSLAKNCLKASVSRSLVA